MTVSNHTASLSRYRPVVLTLTGTLVAYGIYTLYTTWHKGQQPSLCRRDAIRRSRPPSSLIRLRRGLIEGISETERDQQSHHGNQEFTIPHREIAFPENGLLQDVGSLGILVIGNNSGENISVTLKLDALPTARELCDDFGLQAAAAQNARDYIESFFVSRYLERILPQHTVLQLNAQEGELLVEWLRLRGLRPETVRQAIENFTSSRQSFIRGRDARSFVGRDNATTNTSRAHSPTLRDGSMSYNSMTGPRRAQHFQNELNNREGRGNNLESMLFYIAEEQAKQDGYIHRGVSCDSCDVKPIRGVRWRCANCPDYDLCSDCESLNDHPVTHMFYKVKVPARFLGNPKQVQPVLYPGKPELLPNLLPSNIKKRLVEETRYEVAEVEALWEQFRCLANSSWTDDPNHLGAAIDRDAFDQSFVPHSPTNRPTSNLVYDRMFAFYDSNRDGLIGYEEFIKGLSNLHSHNRDVTLRQVFNGYDLDEDGYVSRKDFLRMFRAYYAIQKDITHDLIAVQEEQLATNGVLTLIQSGQPLSAAFNDLIPVTERRMPDEKPSDSYGDAQVSSTEAVLESSADIGDRRDVIGDAIPRFLRNHGDASDVLSDSSESSGERQVRNRIPELERNISQAINDTRQTINETNELESFNHQEAGDNGVPSSDMGFTQLGSGTRWNDGTLISAGIPSSTAYARNLSQNNQLERDQTAISERWRRRHFYIDEEEGFELPKELIELDRARNCPSVSPVRQEDEEKFIDNQNVNKNCPDQRARTSDEKRFCNEYINSGNYVKESSDDSISSTLTNVASGHNVNATVKPHTNPSQDISQRSRSSSKARFEDNLDIETRSNTSTASRPIDERWGGFEIPEAEFDIGREVLYQVTQQALNEILDPLFKEKEDVAMQVWETKALRKQLSEAIDAYCEHKNVDKGMDAKLARQRLLSVDGEGNDKGVSESQLKVADPSVSVHVAPIIHNAGDAELGHHNVENPEITDGNVAQSSHDQNIYLPLPESIISESNESTPSVLDSSILNMSLDQLLKSSGYAVKEGDYSEIPLANIYSETPVFERILPDLNDNRKVFSEDHNRSLNCENSVSIGLSTDPTLPQNRPNSLHDIDMPQGRLCEPSIAKAEHTVHQDASVLSSVDIKTGSSSLGWENNLREKRSSSQSLYEDGPSAPTSEHSQPSEALLARLALLNVEDREIKERNGPGRISFEEFVTVLQNDHRGDLAFVEEWLETASF